MPRRQGCHRIVIVGHNGRGQLFRSDGSHAGRNNERQRSRVGFVRSIESSVGLGRFQGHHIENRRMGARPPWEWTGSCGGVISPRRACHLLYSANFSFRIDSPFSAALGARCRGRSRTVSTTVASQIIVQQQVTGLGSRPRVVECGCLSSPGSFDVLRGLEAEL